jgi:serralysin
MPGVSASGLALLKSITAGTIWGETSLQYYVGGSDALTLDSEFSFGGYFSGNPDATYAFSQVTANAYEQIDAVSQLDFSQTFTTSVADFVLVSVDNNPKSRIEGFFNFPGTSSHDGNPNDSWQFGAFNSALDQMLATPEVGGGEYANWTVLHEIGHSLGLKHTHREVNGLPPLATVGAAMDNEKYSVMSYHGASNAKAYGHAVSFMALDVAALQALYGAEDHNTSTSAYIMSDAKTSSLVTADDYVRIGRAYYCIWDSAGRDTIYYETLDQSTIINLNDATLNTSGVAKEVKDVLAAVRQGDFFDHLSGALQKEIVDPWHHAGGFFSRILKKDGHDFVGTDGGFSIAHGAQIEAGVGGAAADLMIGNEGDNTLWGNSGDDEIYGSGGADSLIGDTQNDLLDGGRGADILDGGDGNDIFVFSRGYGFDQIIKLGPKDLIDLSDLPTIENFKDLWKHHLSKVDNDLYIEAGKDVLVINDLKMSELRSTDFIF